MNRIKTFFKELKKHKGLVAAIILVLFAVVWTETKEEEVPPEEVSYVEFQKLLKKGEVEQVDLSFSDEFFTFTNAKEEIYQSSNPRTPTFKSDLLESGVEVAEITGKTDNPFIKFALSTGQLLVFILVLVFALKYMQGGTGANKNFSKAIKPTATFKDLAGNQESKEDMILLVDFLKNPKRYRDMGASLPKGVIFYGPPGTGKTLTAKAIAGEAGVSFFSISGSDFVEKFVGVGASRVREIFKNAKKNTPAIIFIDEIDAIGGSRNNESNSENRQTLNALLDSMDGFGGREDIIVIGATNRLEDLDDAFIRPGRFDKKIAIGLPEMKDRIEIMKVHAANKKFADDVDFKVIAKTTIGMSGAGLATLLNEATIIATSNNHEAVTAADIDEAFFQMVMNGHKKKDQAGRDKEELKLVAWHEAGHALASKLIKGNEVPKVTIVSSTSGAGGVTFMIPKSSGLVSKKEMIDDICVLYAGRAAEELLKKDKLLVTNGASMDIQQATEKLRAMIINFGMSERYGMVNASVLLSREGTISADKEFMNEASKWSSDLYAKTLSFLRENHDRLEQIAIELLDNETLLDSDLERIIATVPPNAKLKLAE